MRRLRRARACVRGRPPPPPPPPPPKQRRAAAPHRTAAPHVGPAAHPEGHHLGVPALVQLVGHLAGQRVLLEQRRHARRGVAHGLRHRRQHASRRHAVHKPAADVGGHGHLAFSQVSNRLPARTQVGSLYGQGVAAGSGARRRLRERLRRTPPRRRWPRAGSIPHSTLSRPLPAARRPPPQTPPPHHTASPLT